MCIILELRTALYVRSLPANRLASHRDSLSQTCRQLHFSGVRPAPRGKIGHHERNDSLALDLESSALGDPLGDVERRDTRQGTSPSSSRVPRPQLSPRWGRLFSARVQNPNTVQPGPKRACKIPPWRGWATQPRLGVLPKTWPSHLPGAAVILDPAEFFTKAR
jgi:hypothetical protein